MYVSSFWTSRSLSRGNNQGGSCLISTIDCAYTICNSPSYMRNTTTFIAFHDTFLRNNPLLRMIVLGECNKRDSPRRRIIISTMRFRIMTLISCLISCAGRLARARARKNIEILCHGPSLELSLLARDAANPIIYLFAT